MYTPSIACRQQPASARHGPSPPPPPASLLPDCGRTRFLHRGEEIYGEGARADEVYEVVSGAVRTCRYLVDGRRVIIQFSLPGEIFGIEAQGRHRFAAEAIADAVVASYSRPAVETWMERDPQAARSWQRFTLARLNDAENRYPQLGWSSARHRLAGFLLDLAGRDGHGGKAVDIPMSRYDIGDYLCLTAETVSRLFSAFRKEGLVADHAPHGIVILDPERLREEAEN